MAKNVRVQDDLYEYVNGDFLRKAKIPDDHVSVGGFIDLRDNVEKTMLKEFRNLSKKTVISDSLLSKAVSLYKACLDTEKREKDGYSFIKEKVSYLDSLHTVEDIACRISYLYSHNYPLPFQMGTSIDMKNTRKYMLVVSSPNIILPDTTYYGKSSGEGLLDIYRRMAIDLITPVYGEESEKIVDKCLAFDRKLASVVKSQEEWADYIKAYNPYKREEVEKKLSVLNLSSLLKSRYSNVPDTIVVMDPKFLSKFKMVFNKDTVQEYLSWAKVMCILNLTSYLDEETRIKSDTYSNVLTGKTASASLEKFSYRTASNFFGEPIGIYYGKKYFGEEAKKDVIALVKELIQSYKERLGSNTWLSKETREKAIVKLDKMVLKIGYPDKVSPVFNYLVFNSEDPLSKIVDDLRRQRMDYEDSIFDKEVDRSLWVMDAHVVNACYNPMYNDITFPAAILQKPFYSLEQSTEENYGGIGTVIGHEISHAFDNNGAQMDEEGNIKDWWTKEDYSTFKKKTEGMVKQFDKLPVGEGKVNGRLVVSENIADNGGVASSIQSIKRIKDNPDFKLFFLNFAKIWCAKQRASYRQLLLSVDVHSPCVYRANIQVRNFPEFYSAFDVKKGDGMYMEEDKRIIIW